MRPSIVFVLAGIIIAVAAVFVIGSRLIDPDHPLLVYAEFEPQVISPNADGIDDVTEFSYEITENSTVTLQFISDDGSTYTFRNAESRAPGQRQVLFSGVVDGYILPDEDIAGTIERRLIPNGEYTWTLTVQAENSDEVATANGTLVIEDADTTLPEITEFTLTPEIFTPNQDGIDDRVQGNVFVEKDADLLLYLENANGEQSFIPPRDGCREADEAGRHCFDYDGGVTGGADPPENGVYMVIAQAQDAEGQRIVRSRTLTIADGGVPFAEIEAQASGAAVVFKPQPYDERYFSDADTAGDLVQLPDQADDFNEQAITMPLGDMLVFRLTVTNYGDSPIRTTAGPWPGTVYQQTQTRGAMGRYEESGAWVVGIQCETSTESYPWRWAIGTQASLTRVEDPRNDNVYYYLQPGEQSVVWGAIRMTELRETRNPQACWAGLIHEDVAISVRNENVGRREIELVRVAESASTQDN